VLRVAARQDRDRLEPALARCLDVPGRAADHDGVVRSRLVQRGSHEVGIRLARVDVVLRRPAVGQVPDVQLVEERLDVLLHRRARPAEAD
jgi:hypothetical protein